MTKSRSLKGKGSALIAEKDLLSPRKGSSLIAEKDRVWSKPVGADPPEPVPRRSRGNSGPGY